MQELVNGLHQVPAAALFTTGCMPRPCKVKEGDLSAGEQHVIAVLYAREDNCCTLS